MQFASQPAIQELLAEFAIASEAPATARALAMEVMAAAGAEGSARSEPP